MILNNIIIDRLTQRPTYSRCFTPTFLSLSTPLFSHIYKPTLSLVKRQMKSFTKKVFILKITSVSYVRNTLISLSNIVENVNIYIYIYPNVKKSLHFSVKNQGNFEFSEIKTLKKTYQFGRSFKFCVRSANLDDFRYLSLDNYNISSMLLFN